MARTSHGNSPAGAAMGAVTARVGVTEMARVAVVTARMAAVS